MKSEIIIAVPKGRILHELKNIMPRAGIEPEADFFDEGSRKLMFNTNNSHIKLITARSFDVATFVAYGGAEVGICGSDVLAEFNYPDIYAPVDLNIGHCRLSVAEKAELADGDDPRRWSHVRVGTKYVETTKRYFAAKGIQAECVKLNGSVELAPALDMCRCIVDLVSSGKTLQENGLREIEKIADVSSRLIVSRPAFKTRHAEIDDIISRFREALPLSSGECG